MAAHLQKHIFASISHKSAIFNIIKNNNTIRLGSIKEYLFQILSYPGLAMVFMIFFKGSQNYHGTAKSIPKDLMSNKAQIPSCRFFVKRDTAHSRIGL